MIKVCEHILMIIVIISTKFLMLMIWFLLMRGLFRIFVIGFQLGYCNHVRMGYIRISLI